MRIRTPEDLAAVIREARRQQGIDQALLARRAGVSRQWLIAVEQGKPTAALGLVLRTLNALAIDLNAGGEPPRDANESGRSGASDLDALLKRARDDRPIERATLRRNRTIDRPTRKSGAGKTRKG